MLMIPRRHFLGGLALSGIAGLFGKGLSASTQKEQWLHIYPEGLSESVSYRLYGTFEEVAEGYETV